jgi:hypothetical protein
MPDRPPPEDEIVRTLANMAADLCLGIPKQRRAAAKDGLIDLCGMVVALRRRVERLESQAVPEYRGVWKPNLEYSEASFVTHGGSIWHANKSTKARPGGNADWTLACKHGADGKDAR